MHNFLVAICPIFLWVFAVSQLGFIVLFSLKFKKLKKIDYLFGALVSFGLFYDSLMLAFGVFLKASDIFKVLSQFRFILHGGLIPLVFIITAYFLDMNKTFKIIFGVFTGLLCVLGICEGFANVLEVSSVAGIVRYASSKELTPAWARGVSSLLSFGAVAPLMIGGIVDIVKHKSPLFFLSGFLMFVFAAIGPATGNMDLIFFISMFGEFCLMLFMLLAFNKKYSK